MKKTRVWILLTICLLLGALTPAAWAAETASGTCGDNLTWSLSGGTLTVSGSGDMAEGAPWSEYQDRITAVVFSGGVTTVAAEAFQDYENLTTVDFGSAMREIDTRAFAGCVGLTTISLPSTFRRFGESCFEGCTGLTTVYCAGGMPSFNGNCLWNGGYITVYYPVNNPWPAEEVQKLMTNFGGRLTVTAGSYEGSDSTAQTTAATAAEETTAATTAPETEPVTEATTAPTTEATAAPTTAPAQTETEQAETTVPATEPEEDTDSRISGSLIAMLLIVGVLSCFALGALIFRNASHKGGKYRE